MDKVKKLLDYKSIIILALYMAVVFVPELRSYEIMTPQWLYLSIVNLVVFGFLLYTRDELKINIKNKLTSFFFLSHIGFLLISVVSMVKSISTDESLLYISWYATFFGAILNFYFILNKKNKLDFNTVAKLISIVLLAESFSVVSYFLSHYSDPRSVELVLGLKHYYGNRNILAIALAIKLPFALYLFLTQKRIIKVVSGFVVLIAISSVLFIGARTSILAILATFILIVISYLIINKKDIKNSFSTTISLIIVGFFAILLSLSTNKINSGFNSFKDLVELRFEKDLYLDLPSTSLVDSNGRFLFWKEALKDIKENPILGLGSGNWKFDECDEVLAASPNTAYMNLGQPHNDFLQHFLEEGIFGFLFYLAIYVIVLIILIKKLYAFKLVEHKFIIVTIASALMAYTIDAFLNFPHERPTIQIFFALFLVLALTFTGNAKSNNHDTETEKLVNKKAIAIAVLALGVFTFIINYKMFQSAQMQLLVIQDTTKKNAFETKFSMSYNTFLRRFPEFPDAMILGESIEHTKALYAISDGDIPLALDHLSKSIHNFPNSYVSKGLKAMVFHNLKQYDSSMYYAREVFDKTPSITANTTILANLYVYNKDTLNLFKVLNKHLSVVPKSDNIWRQKASCVLKYRKDVPQAIRVLDSGLYYNPESKVLIGAKQKIEKAKGSVNTELPTLNSKEFEEKENQLKAYFDKGNNFFTAKNYNAARIEYLKALDISPGNIPIFYKLGFLEKNTKNYQKSIDYFTKVINDDFTNDGRPEYNRATAYLYLGDQVNARKDFTTSRNKGYPLALKMDASKFD